MLSYFLIILCSIVDITIFHVYHSTPMLLLTLTVLIDYIICIRSIRKLASGLGVRFERVKQCYAHVDLLSMNGGLDKNRVKRSYCIIQKLY